jgi:type II secretory pathway pseudopilin PulG
LGILSASSLVAIPNFVSMQYKSKRAEIPQNLKAIKTAQLAYEAEYDVYVRCAAYPSSPTKTTQQWTKASSGGFKVIDFQPDGDVRGSYMVSTTATNFTVIGVSDVDGDGVYATYTATKSLNPNAPITAPDVY